MEFSASLENFQESVLACRPRDVMGFAVRYFKDERQPNPEEAHAVHMLPFLLFNNQKFKNAACTIYCHQLTVENAFRRSLEPSVVCNVLSRIDMQAMGLKSKSIDEAAEARIMALKDVDFNDFISCLRFPLSSYQLVVWLHCKLAHVYEEIGPASASSGGAASPMGRGQTGKAAAPAGQTQATTTATANSSSNGGEVGGAQQEPTKLGILLVHPPKNVELHRLKQYLTKAHQMSTSSSNSAGMSLSKAVGGGKYSQSALGKVDRWAARRSCAYHLHDSPDAAAGPAGDASSSPGRSGAWLYGASAAAVGAVGMEGGDGVSCGVAFTEAEARSLMRLLGNTVDGLLDSGGPNTVTTAVLVDAFMNRYLKQLPALLADHK